MMTVIVKMMVQRMVKMMVLTVVMMMVKMMVIVWLRALPVSIVAPSACQAATRKAGNSARKNLELASKLKS